MKEQQDVLVCDARERHRAQASRVFISLDGADEHPGRFNVANTSDQRARRTPYSRSVRSQGSMSITSSASVLLSESAPQSRMPVTSAFDRGSFSSMRARWGAA